MFEPVVLRAESNAIQFEVEDAGALLTFNLHEDGHLHGSLALMEPDGKSYLAFWFHCSDGGPWNVHLERKRIDDEYTNLPEEASGEPTIHS